MKNTESATTVGLGQRRSLAAVLWISIIAFLALANGALAVMTYSFAASGNGGEITDNRTVSAEVDFTVSQGQIVITLRNTTPDTFSANQLLTGLQFRLTDGSSPVTNSVLTSGTGIARDIAADGTYTDSLTPVDLLDPQTWKLTSGLLNQLEFHPNAEFALIGPANGETATTAGTYNANGSIEGNDGHNPFVAKIATFVLSSSSITDLTKISDVRFQFNTNMSYSISPIPEPSTIGIFGIGLGGACAFTAIRRRKVRQESP